MNELNWAKLFEHGGQVRLRVAGVRPGLETARPRPLPRVLLTLAWPCKFYFVL